MNDPAKNERRPFWLSRGLWLSLLIVAAVVYFGSYYRHGINFKDEGGTLTLLGGRILNGEVPFREVELGYNVGWFLPIAALFKFTGVHFVALRIFFLALSGLAAVLGYLTIERLARHTGRDKLASPLGFLTGLMLVVVPGMIFKNYNPLAVIANSWCLVGFLLADGQRKASWRALIAGLVLGATWLVRIDLGTFFSVLWLGVLFLRLFGLPGTRQERAAASGIGLALLVFGVIVTHLPVVMDAKRRGYSKQFLNAYPSHWNTLVARIPGLAKSSARPTAPAVPAAPTPAAADTKSSAVIPCTNTPPAPATPAANQGSWKNETLSRVTLQQVLERPTDKRLLGLYVLTYFPLVVLLPLIGWAGIAWLSAVRNGKNANAPLAALALLGGSLTLFPQFFFWRPDAPHLSEFGPGYWVAVMGATLLLSVGMKSKILPRIMFALILLHSVAWLARMLPDRWCGTAAARANRKVLFDGENGVRVYEQKKTAAWMNEALELIRKNSGPDDYLIAYPYHPSFNVFANRRTYERNVYVDNATASPRWGKAAIERIEKHRPAIIVVSDVKFNDTEASRFRNWASDTYAHIKENYQLLKTFVDGKDTFEVFGRKPDATNSPEPETPAQ